MKTELEVHVVRGNFACIGAMRDLSLAGARIELPLPIEPGSLVELIFVNKKQRFNCTVIWAKGNEIGALFEQPAHGAEASTAA